MQGLRRSIPLLVSLVLLLGLGALGLVLVGDSREAAEAAYRRSNLERERVIASLAEQYVQLAAHELSRWSAEARFALTPGHPTDAAALAALIDASAFFDQGAALHGLDGQALTAHSGAPGLPLTADPGHAPLRAALRQGRLGVSSLMSVRGVDMIAVGVSVPGAGGQPAAVLVGYFRAAASPLQAYSESLRERSPAAAYIVDVKGRIVSSRQDAGEVGQPVPLSPALAAAGSGAGVVHFRRAGVDMVAAYAPIGATGWILVEELDEHRYYGALRSKSEATTVGVIVLLVAGTLVALFLNRRAELARLRGRRRAEALIRDAGDIITVLDRHAMVTYTSPAALRVLGVTPDEAIGRSAFSWVHPEDQERMRTLIADLMSVPGMQCRAQARIQRSDGDYIPCDMNLTNALADPDVRGVVLNLRDIAELMGVHEELERQAHRDPLTDLANRALLERRIGDRLGRPADMSGVAAALFIDLDGFKHINDTRGHDVGDALLVEVSERLRRCVRDQDTVARLGGDEFVIFLDGVDSAADASDVAARALREISAPYPQGPEGLLVSASIGVALARPGQTSESLLREADTAMYRAKGRGKDRFELSAA